jgi:hypothetical protein
MRRTNRLNGLIIRLWKSGAAPRFDLVAGLVMALGIRVADLPATTPDLDDLAVTRQHAKKVFEDLLRTEDRGCCC